MRISVWSHDIDLTLQIKIRDAKRVNIFSPCLNGKLVRPPAVSIFDVIKNKFVQNKLAVKRKFLNHIPFEIHTQQHIVRTAILLFNGPIEYYRVEIIDSE